MSNAEIHMHQVKSIAIKTSGNSRRIRIETEDGYALDITLFGNTSVLETLPKNKEFRDADIC